MHEQHTFFNDYVRPLLGYLAGLGVVLFKHFLDILRDRKAKDSAHKRRRTKDHGGK